MKKLLSCLVCESMDLNVHFDMGLQPLINNLKNSQEEIEMKYPLIVNECKNCSHKQLSVAVDRELLFSDYLYQTGASNTHRKFFRDFVRELKGNSVLDIGCNDCSLLEVFYKLGFECIGIDPSAKFSPFIKIIKDFFPSESIDKKFDVITAFNVLAHNYLPAKFLMNMKELLNENGKIYILNTRATVDNYYHEHISYFSIKSMIMLTERCGLNVIGFKEVSMHGKSYLFELEKSKIEGFSKPICFEPLVAYGASAGGSVLLNYFGIYPQYVIDDNPLKQGKFIPGVNIPIYDSSYLKEDHRDLNILITAHHLYQEIIDKIKILRPNRNDTFINIGGSN